MQNVLRIVLTGWTLLAAGQVWAAGTPAPRPQPADTPPVSRIPALIQQMAEDDLTGQAAMRKLVQIGRPAVPALIKATRHPVPRVRYWSIAALSSIADERAVPAVTQCLDDENAMVRAVGVWHLGRWINRPDVRRAVADKLSDPDLSVRGWALRRIQASELRSALPQVRKLLEAPEPEARYDALHALAALEGRAALTTLKKLLQEDKSPIVREGAVRCTTVIQPPTPQSAQLMIDALRDTDAQVRQCAVELLRKGFGQHFGFDPKGEPLEREQARQQWRNWYEANKSLLRWNAARRRFETPDATVRPAARTGSAQKPDHDGQELPAATPATDLPPDAQPAGREQTGDAGAAVTHGTE